MPLAVEQKATSSEVVFVNVVLIRSPKIVSRRYASVKPRYKNKYEMPRNIPPVQHANQLAAEILAPREMPEGHACDSAACFCSATEAAQPR